MLNEKSIVMITKIIQKIKFQNQYNDSLEFANLLVDELFVKVLCAFSCLLRYSVYKGEHFNAGLKKSALKCWNPFRRNVLNEQSCPEPFKPFLIKSIHFF